MNKIKIVAVSLLSLAAVGGWSTSARAELKDGVDFRSNFAYDATLPSGTTPFAASINCKFYLGGDTTTTPHLNKYKMDLLASDGTILKPQRAGTDTTAILYVTLLVPSGSTVTLDLTDESIEGLPFQWEGGLWVEDGGTFIVKGRDELCFGRALSYTEGNAAGFRAKAVAFVDASGAAYESPKGVTFKGCFLDVVLPEAANSWSIAEGSRALIDKTPSSRVLEKYVKTNAETGKKTLTLDSFDLSLLDKSALAADIAVTVGEGRTLCLMPRTVVWESDVAFNYNGKDATVLFNDVTLNGGTFKVDSRYQSAWAGAIGGTGHFIYDAPSAMNGANGYFTVSNAVDFAGDVTVTCEGTTPSGKVVFSQSNPGGDGHAVVIGNGCTLVLQSSSATATTWAPASITCPDGAAATLSIGKNTTVQLDTKPSDGISFVGSGVGAALTVNWEIAAGTYEQVAASGCRINRGSALSDEVLLFRQLGLTLFFRPGKVGEEYDLSPLADFATAGTLVLDAADGATYRNVPANVQIRAAAGVTTTVKVEQGVAAALEAAEGAHVTVAKMPIAWENIVTQRWDFSTAEYDNFEPAVTETLSGQACPVASNIYSCAGREGTYYLQNDKWNSSISPILATGMGPNGLTYMSLVSGCRRGRFIDRATGNSAYSSSATQFKPKFATLVFGSQKGGGAAIFGNTANAAYRRAGLYQDKTTSYIGDLGVTNKIDGSKMKATRGILNDSTIDCWLDGVKLANPSNTPFNGGWQVVSIDTSAFSVDGFGFVDAPSHATDCGCQNYGEVIFFSEKPTAVQQAVVERLLASKWGVTTYADAGVGLEPIAVTASGTGTLTLGDDVVLAGDFRGTVEVNGKNLALADVALPPDASVVAEAGTPACWFDPEKNDTDHIRTSYYNDSKCTVVNYLFDSRWGDATEKYYFYAEGRSPKLDRSARGYGSLRNWLDFSPKNFVGTTASCRNLRMKQKDVGENAYAVYPVTAQTVILVTDSSKGGGTPFLDTLAGNVLSQRNREYNTYGPTLASDPVWRDKSATLFKDSTYLDGVKVDGSTVGFSGGPQVLSAIGTTTFPFGALGNIYYLFERTPNDIDEGEILGEVICYPGTIAEADRRKVEAYLAWKWFGKAINGYGCQTNLTVTGAGTVTVASGGQIPQFGASFTGAADLTKVAALAFTLDTTGATPAILGARTFAGAADFGTAATAQVALNGKIKPGDYTLVAAQSGLSKTTWTLDTSAVSGGLPAELVVTDTAVTLSVRKSGLLLLVR